MKTLLDLIGVILCLSLLLVVLFSVSDWATGVEAFSVLKPEVEIDVLTPEDDYDNQIGTI